jgi:hypothetical protein
MMKFAVGVLAGIGLAVLLDRIASDYHENVIASFALMVGLVAAVVAGARLYTWLMTQRGNAGGNTPSEFDRISEPGRHANSL